MEKKKLCELMDFTLGKNPTRLKVQAEMIYSTDDFATDLHSKNDVMVENCCIINLIKSSAAPISKNHIEKCIISNYMICSFDSNILDPWYFCYQFNVGREIEQQIEMFHQGTTKNVKKLNTKTIGDLEIQLFPIEKQKIIGKLYRQSIIQNDLMKEKIDRMSKFTLKIIRMIEEDQNEIY